jgi:hypothetical protein
MLVSFVSFAVLVVLANRLGLVIAKCADWDRDFRLGAARWIVLLQPLACVGLATALGQVLDIYGAYFRLHSSMGDCLAGFLCGFLVSVLVFPTTYYTMRDFT